ncbi:helix-turn-helix domain-containing protein [Mammaliicoccus sciuri]|uniref:helix-turn-helix domain-containing protein n=3 Tax=Mammaliicoccus sciuri TaxID=1296 RepID=UPI00194ECBBE|nr:helix-turn-helix transcriptional regulator [Mammaliicoccus sciuri]MCD8760763.1 helix-turn-helix transcriptional regulator [Mammaliicoccus sciuri]CAG7913272.1 HTH-type transcriptional regulator Xre [Mammaliicoccus sciuri]
MFSTNLQKLRKQKRLTQVEMAKTLGVAKTTYASYEQNRRMPDNNIQNKIADFFNVTLDELHGRNTNKSKNIEDDIEVLMFEDKDGWDELPKEKRKQILQELSDLADFYIEKEKRAKDNRE